MTDIIPDGYEKVMTLDSEGNQLYILHVEDKEVTTSISRTIKTTEVSDALVMTTRQVPLLDSNGVQKTYTVTQPVYEQIHVLDNEGNETGEYTDGTEIIGQEPTGQILKLWTTESIQETDESNNKLYWNTVYDEVITYEKQPDILITQFDDRYSEDLEPAFELVELPKPPQIPLPKSPEQLNSEIIHLTEQLNPKNADEVFQSISIESASLDEVREKKIAQLSYWCNHTILNGFVSDALGEEHTYDFDEEAQRNLSGRLAILNANPDYPETFYWKTKDSGTLEHNKAQFIDLCADADTFKDSMIAKYWTLKTQALTSEDKNIIAAITW